MENLGKDQIFFNFFGNHKNISLPVKSTDFKDIIESIKKNYKNYVLSSNIAIAYDPIQKEGNIIAGFHHIAKFVVKKEEIKTNQIIYPSKNIHSSGMISPQGDYYFCNEQGHIKLIDELFDSGILKKKIENGMGVEFQGWIQLSALKLYYDMQIPFSQKQIDFLDKLFQKYNLDKLYMMGHDKTFKEILEDNDKLV